MSNKEKLYMEAKKRYYEGSPIMTDTQFDKLEEDLKSKNSSVIREVGYPNEKSDEIEHLSAMLSLMKIQVNDIEDKSIPTSKFNDWISKYSAKNDILVAEPKFDGSSCNLIYNDGRLISASTRGNGIKGTNILNKVSMIVPETISNDSTIEIRGEIIIKSKIFAEKYASDYKNPRNFVAGILARDEVNESIIEDFEFIAFEYRIHQNQNLVHGENPTKFLKSNGFTIPQYIKQFNYTQFEEVFIGFLNYRLNDCDYGLDGFVIKLPENTRNLIGETDHHPKWAIAIKFPPTECVTYIRNIQWNLGQSGEFRPIGELVPIDLDGTTVSNVALHNIGNIIKLGLFPGAKVTIVKSGDIIPIVKNVIEPNFEQQEKYLPTKCSSENCKIEMHGVHLLCRNSNCTSQKLGRLGAGIATFGLENIGGSTIKKLYSAGIQNISDFFDRTKFNKEALIHSGQFKPGRALDIIFESFENRKPITIARIVNALAFKNVGASTAEEIAKIFEGKQPNWSAKSHDAYSPFLNENTQEYKTVIDFIALLSENGYTIEQKIKEEVKFKNTVELTGSPKDQGFKTKEQFIEYIKQYGYSHSPLTKETTYLITDDKESSSSKMNKAKKLNVKIISYVEFLNMIK